MGSLQTRSDGRPCILFIDAFDSFANNITGQLEQHLGAQVTLVHIDNANADKNLDQVLGAVDAVVIGPGPSHPANPSDVGFINKIWALHDANMLPVLGICLGFQSLCLQHGADVKRLQRPRHGIVTKASHRGTDIFANIGDLEATQYHSLHADIGDSVDGKAVLWEPTQKCPSLRPLAWDFDDETNGPILMGVRHTTKPFWGVQFHPESICTSKGGAELIANWWTHASEWVLQQGRCKTSAPLRKWVPLSAPWKAPDYESALEARGIWHLAQELRSIAGPEDVFLLWTRYSAASITPTALLDALGYNGEEVILLDSQGHETGMFDILGLVIPHRTMKVTYKVSDRTLRYGAGTSQAFSTRLDSIDEDWPMLQEVLDLHVPRNWDCKAQAENEYPRAAIENFVAGQLPDDIPFWGGFMGYISYEAGLETIDVIPHTSGAAPDINLAFIQRSIVIDHSTSQVYVQSLLPNDWDWILTVGRTVDSITAQPYLQRYSPDPHLISHLARATITRPTGDSYRAKVREAQAYLHSGDSYELCLTDASTITLPSPISPSPPPSPPPSQSASPVVNSTTQPPLPRDPSISDRCAPRPWPWSWYIHLRAHNPAPHGAFVHLAGTHVLSSSPERFLRWTRAGAVEFRPIKGTVQKQKQKHGGREEEGEGEERVVTRAQAEEILDSAKERAENSMIVDLIRHDLGGVVGAGNVWVDQLMEVEEFERVWHLVSVIRGQLLGGGGVRDGGGKRYRARETDVLRKSLPPGSMTGAPKKRSCDILKALEGAPRGVYSGVLGYMDVGGGGDFSVVIRTAVKCETDGDGEAGNVWRVGAGGAVTVQSTDEDEFLEMEAKASSVLDALFKGIIFRRYSKR